jgi:hypothetical protein
MSLDALPSTGDIHHTEQDEVLGILKTARKRYKRNGILGSYIEGANVCAVGALGVAVGLDEDNSWDGGPSALVAQVETHLRESAKQAIRLVEKAAVKLYPQSAVEDEDLHFAIERLNELLSIIEPFVPDWSDDFDYIADQTDNDLAEEHWEKYNKVAVLAAYDLAIAVRQAKVHNSINY